MYILIKTYEQTNSTYDGLSEGPKLIIPVHLKRFGLSGSLTLVSKLKKLRTSILKKKLLFNYLTK